MYEYFSENTDAIKLNINNGSIISNKKENTNYSTR